MFYKKFTKNINKLLFTVKKLEKYNILVRNKDIAKIPTDLNSS